MLHYLALLLYVGAFVLWLRALARGGRGREGSLAFGLAASGVALHTVGLTLYTLEFGELPLAGLSPALSTLALLMGLGLMATLALGEASRVGIVLVPLMVVLEGTAAVLGVSPRTGPPLDFQGAWFALHVTLSLAAYGGMAVAFAGGALYLVQFHELKVKRLGRLFRFTPSLAALDRLVKVGLVAAVVFLTLGLGLGWAWTVRFRASFQVHDPKVLWGIFSWFVAVTALAARLGSGLRERRGALGAVLGFGVVLLAYVVLRVTLASGGFFL